MWALVKALVFSRGGLVVIAVLLISSVIGGQWLAIKHEKAAQIDPATKKTWKTEAQASMRDLATCQGNVITLQGSISRQNAAVAADKAAGDLRAQRLVDALQGARVASAAASKRSAAILAHKAIGADECAKLLDVDKAILGAGS